MLTQAKEERKRINEAREIYIEKKVGRKGENKV